MKPTNKHHPPKPRKSWKFLLDLKINDSLDFPCTDYLQLQRTIYRKPFRDKGYFFTMRMIEVSPRKWIIRVWRVEK